MITGGRKVRTIASLGERTKDKRAMNIEEKQIIPKSAERRTKKMLPQ
jgi:hypothetical protein